MMDFKLILLLVGLGLLLLVSVFVLLGCFAGLKKELKCTAIAFLVLVLTLLVFGNSSTILDANGSLLKNFIQGIPSSAETVWDCILALVQTNVPGGAEIFVEGTKSYAFLYSVVSGVARGAMLIVGTLIMFILSTIGLGIYRLVSRIVAHSKAKRRAESGIEEPQPEEDKVISDNVLVAQSEAGEAEGVMITARKEPVKKGSSKHRVWAGCLAGLRAVVAIIFLLAPVSGVCSVLDSISPETEKIINESLSGGKQNAAANDTVLDMALDFKDAYYESSLGKFIEGSKFFFKDSFSTHLFDSAFKIEGENNDIEIREEAIVIIEAVNALKGNTNLKELQQAQLENALDALKDSELLVEAMPVAIEVVYYFPINENGNIALLGDSETLKDFLFASKQQAAFLQLRQLDWDKNIEVLLDVVKEAYKLGILEDDFNVLTMDSEQLSVTLAELAKADAVNSILNIVIQAALKHQKVTELVGELPAADLSKFDWAKEYQTIVAIYENFQEFGITSFEGFDVQALVEDILDNEEKLQVVVDLIQNVTELQLVNEVAFNAAIGYVSNIKFITDAGTDVVQAVKDLKNVDWAKDINIYVEALVEALKLVEFEEGLKVKVDYLNLDVEVLRNVIDTLFATESFEQVLPIAANIALGLPKVQELFDGQEVVINTANINWNQDFTTLVNIYSEFQNLEVSDIKEITADALAFVKEIFAEAAKVESVKSILLQLADTTLFNDVAVPAANAIVAKLVAEKAPNFDGILDLTEVTEEEWKNDFESLINIAQNVYDICGFDFNLNSINFDEVGGNLGTETIDLLLNLNILGNNETKNQLVLAALAQFKLFDEETLANIDLSGVKWVSDDEYSENANLQAILVIASKMAKLEGVDLNNLTFDWNTILENDDTYEYVVDLLDVVVDSNLILELLPNLLQKFVVPEIGKVEDEDGTINDLINNLDSTELILEVQKLVDVAKAVVELNVLKVKDEGIQAVDFANTDAIKTIINGIFDTKLLEGYEGRLLRILLKATGVFPELEKGIFDHVDFDKEQELLISAIDELEIVLQDENFLTFDENGKLKLEKEFFLKDETLDAFLGALKTLLGEYNETVSVDGSQIVEVLLPEVINKFVINLIPEQFAELSDILNLENAHPRLLADDVRKVLYIAEILIDEQVQLYFQENDYNFANGAEAIQKVITTIFDLNMIHGSEAELVAWALNYVQTSAKLNIETFTPEHFANVDWDLEVANINELLADVIKFTNINKISSVNSLVQFIKDKGYLADDFLEEINYKVLIEVIEDVFNLQLVEELLPVGLEYALKLAKEKDFDLSFLGETMTGELLVEDLMSIVDALEIAVYDIEVFEYKKAGWTGALPELQYVNEILDIIVNLNIVKINENDLLTFVVKKFIPKNDFVNDTDFAFDAPFDLNADVEVIKEALAVVYELIYANNMTNIEQVVSFFKEQWYMNTDLVKDYNLYGVADLLETLSDLQLLQQALFAAIDNIAALDALTKLGDFSSLTSLSKEELVSDLKTIAQIVRLGVEANLLQYYELQDLNPIEYAKLAVVLEEVGKLNILNQCASSILPSVLNNLLANNQAIKLEYEFTEKDFANVNWAEETKLLGSALVELGAFAEVINLDSLSDILLFINNKDFLDQTVHTTENANKLVDVLAILADSQLVAAALPAGVEFGISAASQQGLDISFLSGALTNEELLSDLNVVVEIARNAIAFGAVDYLVEGNIENIDVNYIVNIVALLEELNVLTCAQGDWTALVVNFINPLLKAELKVSALDYQYVDFANENELLQQAVVLIGELISNENLESVYDILQFIENKDYLNVNAYNDRAISNVQDLLVLLAQSEIVAVNLTELFEFGVEFAEQAAKLDLSFLKDRFSAEELQEDILTIVEISKHAYEFGVADLIFTGDVVINVDPVIEIVKLLEELNIVRIPNDYIAELVFNMILPKLGLEEVTLADFVNVNFANENAVLVAALEEVKALLEIENLVSVSDLLSFITNREFLYADKYEEVYTEEALEIVYNIVKLAASSELVQLELVELFNLGVSKIPGTLDLSFLKDSVTVEELVSDVDVLIEIAKLAVEFGALELIFTSDIKVINLDIVAEIVALFEQLNVLTNNNTELTALVYNLVYDKLGINQKSRSSELLASEFDNINYASENVKLQEVIILVKNLQADFELVSLLDVIEFVQNGTYKEYKEFKPSVYTHAQEIVNAAVDFELVRFALPTLLNFGLDKLVALGLDLTYMSDAFTAEELASDIKVLVNEAVRWVRDLSVLDVLETKEIKGQYVGELANTIRALKDVNIATYKQSQLVTVLTNFIYEKVFKYDGYITEVYFVGIDWDAEIDRVADVLDEVADIVETFFVKNHLLSIESLNEFIKNDAKNFELYNDEELLNDVADIFYAISKSDALAAELEFALEYLVSFLNSKDVDVASILSTKEELQEDLVVLGNAVKAVYPTNVLGFAFLGEELNQDNFDQLVDVVTDILSLNVLSESKADILYAAFSGLGVNVNKVALECIDWNVEIEVISDLLYAVNDLLLTLELTTISEITTVNVKDYLTVNYNTNDILAGINNVLDVVIESQLVEETLFGLSEKFLVAESLAGLADIHNIYNNFQELEADIINLMAAIDGIIELDLCAFLVEGDDIPYEKVDAIEAIITNLFGLNYLNNDGRLAELTAKVSSIDVSSVDFSQIDLIADAKLIVGAYKDLLPILTDSEFFVKNINDLKALEINNIKYWAKDVYFTAVKNSVKKLIDTTIVRKTNGAIFLLALPLFKLVLPDYYEAIDPERLTVEQISEDFNAVVDLAKQALELDRTNILNGVILTDEIEELVIDAINTIANLNLFDGRVAQIVLVTANRLDSKTVFNYYFDKDLYNFDDINYDHEAEILTQIVKEVFDLVQAEGINDIGEVKAYFTNKQNIKDLVKDETQVERLLNIAELVAELDLVKFNILPVYNEALEAVVAKYFGDKLADSSNAYSSSEEMHADLVVAIDLARKAVEFGVLDILQGATINYDQAALVKDILNDIAALQYVNANKQNILEFVDSKVRFDLSQINLTSMNLANDLAIFGEMYEQLIPVLLSEHNPFTTLDSIKSLSIVKADLYALVYDYQSIYPSVVRLASEVSIAPELIKLVAEKVGNRLSGLLLEVYEIIDIQNVSNAELIEDLLVVADILENVEKLDLLRKVLYKEDIYVNDSETIAALVENVFELNLIDNKFADLVELGLERVLNLDLTDVDLTTVNTDSEQALIVEAVRNGVVVVNSLGIEKLSQVKPYIRETLSAVKEDVKEAIKLAKNKEFKAAVKALVQTALAEGRKVNGAACLELVDLAVESEFVAKLVLPVYEQKVYSRFSGTLAELADLSDYNEELLKEDLLTVKEILHIVYDSQLYKVVNTKVLPGEDIIPYLEDIVRNACELNILDVKVEDLAIVLEKVYGSHIDLSAIDFAAIDFEADKEIYASLVEYAYVLAEEILANGLNKDLVFNTVAYNAVVDAYEVAIDTTFVQVLAPQVMKATFGLASEKLGGTIAKLINALDINSIADEELLQDLPVYAEILRDLEAVNAYALVLNKEDIAITDADAIAKLVEDVFKLVIVDNKFNEFVGKLVEKLLNVDLTNVDLASVNYQAEQTIIVEAVRNGVVIANSLGVEKLSDVKPYLVNTLSAVKSDVKEAIELAKNKEFKAAVKALIETALVEAKKVNLDACLTIVDYAVESEFVAKLVLPVYEQKVYTRFSGTLAELADLSDYNEDLLKEDLFVAQEIIHIVYDALKADAYHNGTLIDYAQEAVLAACELNILDVKVEDLAIVLEKVYGSHIDLSAIDFAAIDFEVDKEIYASLVEYAYVIAKEIKNNGLNKDLVFNTVAYNAVVDAYEVAIDTTFVQVLAPQVMKATFGLAAEKLGGTIAKLINALDINSIADEELLQDLPVYAEILRDLEAVNAYALVLNKEDIAITDADAFAKLVEDAFKLVIVDYNFGELLVKAVEKVLNVDLSNVDMTSVDYDAEQALFVEAVRNGVVIANSLGVENLSDVKPYLVNTLSAVKSDVKEAIELAKNKQFKAAVKALIETVVEEGRDANGAACLELVDLVAESELVVKLALPIYEQLIASRFSGILGVIADLSAYDEAMLSEDLALLAEIAHSIYESKVYGVILTKDLPGTEVIPYLEDIVRNAAMLNIIEAKKADIFVVAQAVLDKLGLTEYIRRVDKDFDLAQYDLDSISFKADAEIYVSMVPYACEVVAGLFESGLNTSFFANTDAIYALVEIYTLSIETTLVQSFAGKAFAVVDKLNAKLPVTINVNEEEVLYNISDFLFGLVELGVFSNDGIDFTDAATIEMMKQAVLDSVALPAKLETLVNRVCSRLYAYGVVPFNWDIIDVKDEAKLAYELAKEALSFVKEYASRIKAIDLSMLADANVQADLTEMIETISQSSFVEQLFFPFLEGTFNALTLGYTDGEMRYDATLEDVVNTSVPNFWRFVNAVYEITEFKLSNVNVNSILNNLDAVAEIVEVIATDKMTKDNIAKVMITGIGFFTGVELTDEEKAGLLAIDFANEVQYTNKFFAELKETYEATNFELSLSSIKNAAVLEGLADVLEAVLPSETAKVLVKACVNAVNYKFVNKVSAEMYELINERLSDPAFTNDDLINDLYAVAELMRLVAASNIFGNSQDFTVWNFAAIKQIITVAFDTNMIQGYEARYAEMVINKVPQINELYDGSVVVADWEAEALAIVNALESLVNDGITDINNIDIDAISGTTIENILDSVILADLIIDMINEKLEEQDLDEYYVVTESSLNAVTNWDAEITAINDLMDLINAINSGNVEFDEVISQYNYIRNNTVLVNEILTSCASYVVPKMPIVKDYYDSSMVITDWSVELDAIVAAFEVLDGKHIDTIIDPIDNLNGEIIVSCLESEILKAAFVEEFNNNLAAYGLGAHYTVTVAEVEAVNTNDKWDKELVAIKALELLLEKINNGTITFADVKVAKEAVETTQIAKVIFETVLSDNGITASRYPSVEAMVADFVNDIATWKGVSVSDIDMTSEYTFRSSVGVTAFFATTEANANNPDYKVGGKVPFWNIPEMRDKWSWLLEEIVRVMVTYPGSSQYVKTLGYMVNLAEGYYADSNTFPVYAFWYFLTGKDGNYWGVKFGNGHNAEWL